MNVRLLMLTAAMLGLVAGCKSNDAATDAGPVSGNDAGHEPLPAAAITGGAAPDFTCLGAREYPTVGEPVAFTANFTEALSGTLAMGTVVEFFTNNQIAATCAAPNCTSTTIADTAGNVMLTLPANSLYTFRVPEGADNVTTIGVSRTVPAEAGGTNGETYVGTGTIDLIPGLLGRLRAPGTAIVSGAVYDCQGRPIANTQVHVYSSAGAEIAQSPGQMDPFAGYFVGSNPNMRATSTDAMAGRFAFANIAAGDPVRVEIHAVREAGGEEEVISCEEFPTAANAVVIVGMFPSRSDASYGSGHPCVGR